MAIDSATRAAFAALIGERCCRRQIGRGRSLSLGFGKKVVHSRPNGLDQVYGEWEIGTYSSAWRIIHRNQILCASLEVVDSLDELTQQLESLTLGAVVAIEELAQFDLRITLEDHVFIDFICASADDDEMFHIFCPDNLYVEYTWPGIWVVGKSNTPWP